eukprot:gnl/MRDRNA2_/MRDRNA2_96681_c0_seq1.p1 gnl/MRDRNA2_/MRDRNA2_96681_c0~~gnl/MRDRNA2_/MRDRNA2_96681_c0_seq1.p1  ORF type:complete len:834 (+),score=131.83 gnl/MRDRNA2_/MRDRNA2_96681_c0_seq1:100-2601(+)
MGAGSGKSTKAVVQIDAKKNAKVLSPVPPTDAPRTIQVAPKKRESQETDIEKLSKVSVVLPFSSTRACDCEDEEEDSQGGLQCVDCDESGRASPWSTLGDIAVSEDNLLQGEGAKKTKASLQSNSDRKSPPKFQWSGVFAKMHELQETDRYDRTPKVRREVEARRGARNSVSLPGWNEEEEEADASPYAKISIGLPKPDKEAAEAVVKLVEALRIRRKYHGNVPHADSDAVRFQEKSNYKKELHHNMALIDGECNLADRGNQKLTWDPFLGDPPKSKLKGVTTIFRKGVFIVLENGTEVPAAPPVDEFCVDYVTVMEAMHNRSVLSFCGPRLRELELRFELHCQRNGGAESEEQRRVRGRDFYQVRKVDTHIHHSACFSQRMLMGFIRQKMRDEMDTKVLIENGREMTLREVFASAGVEEGGINADSLCCAASMGGGTADTFGRFDRFNSKYNPFGDKRLRDIFLKTDNLIDGRFLAELTHQVMDNYKKDKWIQAEWRISIYGKSRDEWAKLAKWFRTYRICCPNIRWYIQVPRLYPLFKKLGKIQNFSDMLQNIFEPIFEATLDPAGHADMFYMLRQVVGFDSVDDESQGTRSTLKYYPAPEEWDSEFNPPYSYWMYYMYANIQALNKLRIMQGLNTFTFKPHCGEAGNYSHLISGFMLTDGICHGINLRLTPVLTYLFYMTQIPIAVSPLSNDILFLPLAKNPFGDLFKKGLNVSLSTDDPLIIHLTEVPLVEEYATAARLWKMSGPDLCEIARNSVLQSCFEKQFKTWWVGYPQDGMSGTEVCMKSNVPSIRLLFRADCFQEELDILNAALEMNDYPPIRKCDVQMMTCR